MADPKQWTVMVWMAGDNDLEDFAQTDLLELKAVGSTPGVDVVAQVDRLKDDHTRRYYLRAGTRAEDDVVDDLGETNTGDPAVAADFFTWGITQHPAHHYLGVIWNHGSGIDETDVYRRARTLGVTVERRATPSRTRVPRSRTRAIAARRFRRALFSSTIDAAIGSRAIAYDDTAKDFLDNLELKRVLSTVKRRTGRALDVLGFDACLMSMLELAYELRGPARMIVGSQEVEPGDGWPYDRVLRALAANPAMTPARLGTAIVEHYTASYGREAVTLALLDTGRAEAAARAVDTLAGELLAAMKKPAEYVAVSRAIREAQHYELADFIDLQDLCEQLRRRSKQAKLKAAAADAIAALSDDEEGLVRAERHKGAEVARSHGVSIYVPRGQVTVAYDRLAFAKRTRWDEVLAAL